MSFKPVQKVRYGWTSTYTFCEAWLNNYFSCSPPRASRPTSMSRCISGTILMNLLLYYRVLLHIHVILYILNYPWITCVSSRVYATTSG